MLTLEQTKDLLMRINHIEVEINKLEEIEEFKEFKMVLEIAERIIGKVWIHTYQIEKGLENDSIDWNKVEGHKESEESSDTGQQA